MAHRTDAILITGGTGALGQAIAHRFVTFHMPIVFTFSSNEEKANTLKKSLIEQGVEATAIKCDVSNVDALRETFKKIKNLGLRIQILVNNAGITKDDLAMRLNEEKWASVLSVNLDGAFHCMRLALLDMVTARSGVIVNITSVSGHIGAPGQANYGASKAGLTAATKSIAKEVGRFGIRANCLAPGFIESKMVEDMKTSKTGQQALSMIKDFSALGRMGKPEEVAEAAWFLASKKSSYITGQTLIIDGGLFAG